MSYRSVKLIYNIYRGCHIGLNRFLSLWNWNLEMLAFDERGKLEYLSKNPHSKERTINKLNPHMAPGRNQTCTTLVEVSAHNTVPQPAFLWDGVD